MPIVEPALAEALARRWAVGASFAGTTGVAVTPEAALVEAPVLALAGPALVGALARRCPAGAILAPPLARRVAVPLAVVAGARAAAARAVRGRTNSVVPAYGRCS